MQDLHIVGRGVTYVELGWRHSHTSHSLTFTITMTCVDEAAICDNVPEPARFQVSIHCFFKLILVLCSYEQANNTVYVYERWQNKVNFYYISHSRSGMYICIRIHMCIYVFDIFIVNKLNNEITLTNSTIVLRI